MTAASSCSAIIPPEKYDVFLSFRGEDTRNTFTSHLYEALCRNNILTYKDDEELERGDDISPALLKAISESKLSVIIFSKDYASSTWCLDELVHILQGRGSQFVIPIFYGLDPSDVRKQSGSYADAFVIHEERFKATMDKVLRWRSALTTAANISGFDSQTIRPESELVKIVVNDILAKLNGKSQIASCLEGLVGIEKHIQQVESLLCLDSLDVQIVGIWGMGGIGKTTIADVVFHRLSSQFEACCFIANVREASETKHGLNDLRNQLLRAVLKEENLYMAAPSIGSSFARQRLRRTKALIVLDDVSEFSQLEFLAGGDCNLFGPGSRILVTTRNKRIIRNHVDDHKIYEVKELNVDEALELFHLRAFRNFSPTTDYTTLSREVVDYAGGNPLALGVLGSVFCHCNSKQDWEGELDKLKKFPDKRIQNALRFSYDGLGENEKEIFLDMACYYKGKHIDDAKRILDACGFCANAGVGLLIDMSLISVDEGSRLKMHDLIQEMGHKIVRDQCVKDPGKRSRLWIAKDVCYVLQNNKGTEAIECLVMSMDSISDLYIKPSVFKKMHNLRLLKLQFEGYYYWDSKSCVNKVHLSQGLRCLPQALRILYWDGFPLNSLPSKFCPDNLVELRMRNSRLERLWNKGLQINLRSLKHIDLSGSEHLADVSALFESPNLERIILEGCKSLVQLPSFFQYLAKLTCLSLSRCSNLKILSEMPGNLKVLELERTAIEELPSSIWSLEKLDTLKLGECKELKNLPSSTCRLNSLRSLSLVYCYSLGSLPVELPSGLEELFLTYCKSLGSLPAQLPSRLEYLDLTYCKNLASLPAQLPSGLEYLDLTYCKSLTSLPAQLPYGLNYLKLSNCKSLGSLPSQLPSGLKYLKLSNCKSLGSLPAQLPSGLEYLYLTNCKSLASLPAQLPFGLKDLNLRNCKSLGSLPAQLPSGLKYLKLSNCRSLRSLPAQLPSGLKYLKLSYCKSLGFLPAQLPSDLKDLNLSNCKSLGSLPAQLSSGLKDLDLSNCKSLGSLPAQLPSGLMKLNLSNCNSFASLPAQLPSGLKDLNLSNCKSLGSLPAQLPSGLKDLDLSNCKSLGSLPMLPWLLYNFSAEGCTSLETVSSSRTALIQGWDQSVKNIKGHSWRYDVGSEKLIFSNCLKLDQSAWSNIMADAQLRVLLFAAASQFNKFNWRAELKIVCPGNEIPKWLSYQSEGCSINIKLPPYWFRQGFMDYALCIVVAFNNFTPPPDIENFHIRCQTHCKTNNGDYLPHQNLWENLGNVNSDHVFVWYFSPELERGINCECSTTCEKVTEASFDFMLYLCYHRGNTYVMETFDLYNLRVKRCGASLLFAQDVEKLLGGMDEDVDMEPKQVVEEEDIIIKTKRRRDESLHSGSGTASFNEEDDDQLLSRSSKRKINII